MSLVDENHLRFLDGKIALEHPNGYVEVGVPYLRAMIDELRELRKTVALFPGWICAACGVFNGSAKEELKECRCCGVARP